MDGKWYEVNGSNGRSEINNSGDIRSIRIARNTISSHGYKICTVFVDGVRKTKLLHRVIAETLIDNPNNYDCVLHIDGNKLNNNVNNLKWGTRKHNAEDRVKHGRGNNIKVIANGIKFNSIAECARELDTYSSVIKKLLEDEKYKLIKYG